VHVSAFWKLKRQIAWSIRWSYFPAKLYSENASLWFHVAAVEQLDISFSSYRLPLIRHNLKPILNGSIFNLLGDILESISRYDSEEGEMPSLFEQLLSLIWRQHFIRIFNLYLLCLCRWLIRWRKSLHLSWVRAVFVHLQGLILGKPTLIYV